MPKKPETPEGDLFPAGIPIERLIGLKKRVEDLAAARRTPEMEAECRRFARDLEERVRSREETKRFIAEAMQAIQSSPWQIRLPEGVRRVVEEFNRFDPEAYVISTVYRRQARKRKKRSKSPLSLAVKRLNAPDFDSLLGMLEDADLIDELFEHLSAPIHIHGIEVDREKLKVTYSIRNRLAPKGVGFKRLKEIFDGG